MQGHAAFFKNPIEEVKLSSLTIKWNNLHRHYQAALCLTTSRTEQFSDLFAAIKAYHDFSLYFVEINQEGIYDYYKLNILKIYHSLKLMLKDTHLDTNQIFLLPEERQEIIISAKEREEIDNILEISINLFCNRFSRATYPILEEEIKTFLSRGQSQHYLGDILFYSDLLLRCDHTVLLSSNVLPLIINLVHQFTSHDKKAAKEIFPQFLPNLLSLIQPFFKNMHSDLLKQLSVYQESIKTVELRQQITNHFQLLIKTFFIEFNELIAINDCSEKISDLSSLSLILRKLNDHLDKSEQITPTIQELSISGSEAPFPPSLSFDFSYWKLVNCTITSVDLREASWQQSQLFNVYFSKVQYSIEKLAHAETRNVIFLDNELSLTPIEQDKLLAAFSNTIKQQNQFESTSHILQEKLASQEKEIADLKSQLQQLRHSERKSFSRPF